MNPSTFGKIFK